VGQHRARDARQAVGIGEQVVAAVVADLADHLVVGDREGPDVRGVDDHLATVGDDRFHLVHALGRRPQVVVHRGHDGDHPAVRAVDVPHVHLPGVGGGGRPRLGGRAHVRAEHLVAGRRHHHRDGQAAGRDALGGRLDDRADRGEAGLADDVHRADQRA
jgi:hypothetical protein